MRSKLAITTSNGTSACLTAARALIPNGAITLVADSTYYEVALRLAREAPLRNWTLMSFDPGNISATMRSIASLPTAAALAVWLDQPSNWWLEAADMATLAAAVKNRGGTVIVDISVHPLVPVLAQGADVAIASLSKFPSNGLSLGGVLLTNREDVANRLIQQRAHDASALAAEPAFVISQQFMSFADRFSAVSAKAAKLVDFAKGLPGVRAVRYPDFIKLGTSHGGGVIVLELDDAGRGENAEEIIAQNYHRSDFPLTLACTFGGAWTTFEHFQARGDANGEVVGTLVKALPNNFCRVGIGCESLATIQDALALVFPK